MGSLGEWITCVITNRLIVENIVDPHRSPTTTNNSKTSHSVHIVYLYILLGAFKTLMLFVLFTKEKGEVCKKVSQLVQCRTHTIISWVSVFTRFCFYLKRNRKKKQLEKKRSNASVHVKKQQHILCSESQPVLFIALSYAALSFFLLLLFLLHMKSSRCCCCCSFYSFALIPSFFLARMLPFFEDFSFTNSIFV